MRYKRERHAKPLGLIRQQHLEECLDHIGVISTPTSSCSLCRNVNYTVQAIVLNKVSPSPVASTLETRDGLYTFNVLDWQ